MTDRSATSTSAASWLTDRRLLHLDSKEADALELPRFDTHDEHPIRIDGVIVCGKDAVSAASRLRQRRPDLVVLVEPEAFASAFATAGEPFALPTDTLFPYSLADAVNDQMLNGAPFALTPSGYVRSTAPEALKAIVEQANQLTTDRVIVAIPLEESWLMASRCTQLIAILRRCVHPVVISLGSERKPLNNERARGLVTVLDSVEGIGVMRADHLVGLEALARSSGCAAFGLIPSRRRITPPAKTGSSFFNHDRRQHVLHRCFHRYLSAPTGDQWFANTAAPICAEQCCKGRRTDPFPVADAIAAKNHNACTMLVLATLISGTRSERLATLAAIYYDAAVEHLNWSTLTGQKLKVPEEQMALASQSTPRKASVRTSSPGTAIPQP